MDGSRFVSSRRERRIQVLAIPTLIAITIALVLVRIVMPNQPQSSLMRLLGVVLDTVIGACIVSVFIGVFFFFWYGDNKLSEIKLMQRSELNKSITSDADVSTTWRVKARSGAYFREETLPRMAARVGTTIRVILMDPASPNDLAIYKNMRSLHERQNWNEDSVRANICATIARIVQAQAGSATMSVELHVTRANWVQSLDISDRNSYLCGQRSGEEALVVPSSHEIYSRFIDDFKVAELTSRQIDLKPYLNRSVGSVRNALSQLHLNEIKDLFANEFSVDVSDTGLGPLIVKKANGGHHYG